MDAHARAVVAHLDATPVDPDIRADAAAMLAAVTGRAPTAASPSLSDSERAILEFERLWWRQPGAKEQAIRDSFEISPVRYYQQLNALLDLPQALSYDPTLVHRLLRLRQGAARTRRLG